MKKKSDEQARISGLIDASKSRSKIGEKVKYKVIITFHDMNQNGNTFYSILSRNENLKTGIHYHNNKIEGLDELETEFIYEISGNLIKKDLLERPIKELPGDWKKIDSNDVEQRLIYLTMKRRYPGGGS